MPHLPANSNIVCFNAWATINGKEFKGFLYFKSQLTDGSSLLTNAAVRHVALDFIHFTQTRK